MKLILVVSSCASTSNKNVRGIKLLDERVIEEFVEECDNLTSDGIYITSSDYGMTRPSVVHADKVLQDKTDCHLSVYFDGRQGDIEYVMVKGDPEFLIKAFFSKPRYLMLYPRLGGE